MRTWLRINADGRDREYIFIFRRLPEYLALLFKIISQGCESSALKLISAFFVLIFSFFCALPLYKSIGDFAISAFFSSFQLFLFVVTHTPVLHNTFTEKVSNIE